MFLLSEIQTRFKGVMALLLNIDINDAGFDTPIVKNTFFDFQSPLARARSRNSSVPPSFHLCREEVSKASSEKIRSTSNHTDASTEVQSERWADFVTDSECGTKTPMSLDNCCLEDASSETSMPLHGYSVDACAENLWCRSSSSLLAASPPPQPHPQARPHRLNAKANLFQPQKVAAETANTQYHHRFSEVIHRARSAMESSGRVGDVLVSESEEGWCLIVRPNQSITDFCTEEAINVAKEALLQATSNSKCIYLMGYCGAKPFTTQPQGFEASLGAMENAKSACWHMFKKGFCGHGDGCSKQHPACQMSVRVVVEMAQFTASQRSVDAFKQHAADVAMAVTASLQGCIYSDKVEAFKEETCQGWVIEVVAKEEIQTHKDYLLTLAKHALLSATSYGSSGYVMGYVAKPFVQKGCGFVTMLGDMHDESRACWDFYSKGICTRTCECRWEHPKCLMPISVVIKERSSLKCSAAMLEYLANQGLLAVPPM